MLIHLAINDSLIKEACQLSGQQNASDVARQALLEYIQRCKQLKLLDLFGTVEYHGKYCYKKQREFKWLNIMQKHLDVIMFMATK